MARHEQAVAEAPAAKEAFLAAHARAAGDGPEWLRAMRRAAWERFEAMGFPGPKDEEWRQTPVGAIAGTAFAEADDAIAARLPSPRETLGGPRLVLVNGKPSPELSSQGALPEGLVLRSLSEALADDPTLRDDFGSITPWRDRPFAAVNTAAFRDGAYVEIAAGRVLASPVEIVHVVVPPAGAPLVVHPRVLVRAGPGSEATILETFDCAGEGPYLTNAVTEIAAAANSRIEHVRVQDEDPAAFHVASVDARQARDSRVTSHNVSFGSALTRSDLGSRLEGPGAEAILYGLTVAGRRSHVDHHTSLDHAVPHCPSHEVYKSILWDRARYVFNGRIIVRPDAQKTDARQSNRNLLLSDDAMVFTRPQLEIRADDVRCTHGATIGHLDEEALFYLRARGLGSREARALLLRAFAGEVLENVSHDGLRERLEEEAFRRLPADERA